MSEHNPGLTRRHAGRSLLWALIGVEQLVNPFALSLPLFPVPAPEGVVNDQGGQLPALKGVVVVPMERIILGVFHQHIFRADWLEVK